MQYDTMQTNQKKYKAIYLPIIECSMMQCKLLKKRTKPREVTRIIAE